MIDFSNIPDCSGLQDSGIEVVAPLGCFSGRKALSYVSDRKYLSLIAADNMPDAVFVSEDIASDLPDNIIKIVVSDPVWSFYNALNCLAKEKTYERSFISSSAVVHSKAIVSPVGVDISDGVLVEPGVVIMPGVTLGKRAVIRAGSILGVDGFEHKRTSKGVLSVAHDGRVLVGDDVEVGPGSTVIKGFSFRDTIIGPSTKLDAQVHFAHCAQCGSECFIAANAMIAGSAEIGDSVWIGPSASISSQVKIGSFARITLGSVVTKDVASYEHVSGNFAIPHKIFLKHLISVARGRL